LEGILDVFSNQVRDFEAAIALAVLLTKTTIDPVHSRFQYALTWNPLERCERTLCHFKANFVGMQRVSIWKPRDAAEGSLED